MNTLNYVAKKFNLDLNQKLPINIPILRDEMARLMHELGFKVGVEIGTWDGEHASVLCENIPELELYCVDPWIPYSGYKDYHTNDYPWALKKTRERLKGYNVHILRRFSLDAVENFENRSLDFVYIDGNHDFRNVIDDIDSWKHKVRRGGIVFGHDYHKSEKRWQSNQAYYAVQAYLYANRINPWFTLGVENRKLDYGNGVKSWMYIKG